MRATDPAESSKGSAEWPASMTRPLLVLHRLQFVACTGEMSDFQAIVEFFQEKDLADSIQEDGVSFHSAKDYGTYLSIPSSLNIAQANGLISEEERWIHFTMCLWSVASTERGRSIWVT